MDRDAVIARAAGPTLDVVRGIAPAHLDAPTPCPDLTVRGLVNHLLFWGPSLVGSARKDPVALPAAGEAEVDLAGADGTASLEVLLVELVDAWSDPAAWEGQTSMGSPDPMPAAMIGGMVCGEVVLHGWDLARATDQRAEWDDEVAGFIHEELVTTAPLGREMGVFGPEVAVPDAAPVFDRALGLSGRDRGWRPPPP